MAQPEKPKTVRQLAEDRESREKFLELAREGKDAWNNSRRDNREERVNFTGVDFTSDDNKDIRFAGFEFRDNVDFSNATFGDAPPAYQDDPSEAARKRVSPEGAAIFVSANFGKNACFTEVKFGDGANFDEVGFRNGTRFDGARFAGKVSFGGSNPGRPPLFHDISFSRANFGGVADFIGRVFAGSADFSQAIFHQPPDFRGIEDPDNFDWTGTHFGFYGKVGSVEKSGWTTDTETATKLRRLRKIASEIHAHDAERELFILERMAERGIAWAEWLQKTAAPWKPWWRYRPWRNPWPHKDSWSAWLWRGARAIVATPKPLGYGFARALVLTILMFLYRLLSDCGRSVVWPLFWLIVVNTGFFFWYRGHVAASVIARHGPETVHDSLITFTLSNALPFVGSSRQATSDAVKTLFCGTMPNAVYGITLFQGLTSVLLLFLVGLALRAHFKVR